MENEKRLRQLAFLKKQLFNLTTIIEAMEKEQ